MTVDVWCPHAAENVAKRWELSRKEQDRFAASSQSKAAQAITSGAFQGELVPITVEGRKGGRGLTREVEGEGPQELVVCCPCMWWYLSPGPLVVAEDEHPRPNTTAEGLAKLRPAFDKTNGSVTAGNASGINDGAAAVVLASRTAAQRLGLAAPLARVVSWAQAGVDPAIMGTGPIPAVRKAVREWLLDTRAIDYVIPTRVCLCSPPGGEGRLDIGGCGCV